MSLCSQVSHTQTMDEDRKGKSSQTRTSQSFINWMESIIQITKNANFCHGTLGTEMSAFTRTLDYTFFKSPRSDSEMTSSISTWRPHQIYRNISLQTNAASELILSIQLTFCSGDTVIILWSITAQSTPSLQNETPAKNWLELLHCASYGGAVTWITSNDPGGGNIMTNSFST